MIKIVPSAKETNLSFHSIRLGSSKCLNSFKIDKFIISENNNKSETDSGAILSDDDTDQIKPRNKIGKNAMKTVAYNHLTAFDVPKNFHIIY